MSWNCFIGHGSFRVVLGLTVSSDPIDEKNLIERVRECWGWGVSSRSTKRNQLTVAVKVDSSLLAITLRAVSALEQLTPDFRYFGRECVRTCNYNIFDATSVKLI